MTTPDRINYRRAVLWALVCVVVLAMGYASRDTRATVDHQIRPTVDHLDDTVAQIKQGQINSRASRIEFQAKELFMLCSRDPSLVTETKRGDVVKACAGYQPLDQARRTEAANSPLPK